MVSRCRWPPEKFLPPWATGSSKPPGFCSTNSLAWAVSSACHSSSSVAEGLPHSRLSRMVPVNRAAFWGTTPTFCRSCPRGYFRTFTPSTSTAPLVAS